MPTTPRDIFGLAERLCKEGKDEVTLRSALSRAYYAALLESEATFEQVQRFDQESSHAVVINSVVAYSRGANPGREDARVIAQSLPKMRRLRNDADYHLELVCTAAQAESVLTRALDVLDRCDNIRTRRAAAAAAMAPPPT
ncbi:MAG: hypothetical protein Q8S12_11615 [Hydrogenophaga sp.]|uniref:hypothetical protein n=1 Tax=Hydrogenophaga sp. TaxID=1904254 RepID=UPI002736F672|nr:hypothetical protein [Hydrogenophaga sp.]MDP3627238.1 hypothetical protein [Hydrogenophaga sp.]